MKVPVKATHKVLPDVNELVDSDVLSDKMGELIHMGYDIEDEEILTEIEMTENEWYKVLILAHGLPLDYLKATRCCTVPFQGFDETPVMCKECCETTVKCRLTDVESCPGCGSHKVFEIL